MLVALVFSDVLRGLQTLTMQSITSKDPKNRGRLN